MGGKERSGGGIVRNLCNNRRKRDISMTMLYVKYNQKGFRELQFPSTSSPPILLSHCPLKWDPVDEEARRGGRGEGGEEKSEIREREMNRGRLKIYIYICLHAWWNVVTWRQKKILNENVNLNWIHRGGARLPVGCLKYFRPRVNEQWTRLRQTSLSSLVEQGFKRN